jgi:AcrR family transcriptional regulator
MSAEDPDKSPEKAVSARVRRKRDERRERIVEAAFRAIAEDGPADFSLNQLARTLDYTPGALYWYFPSKESLVLEIQSRAFAQLTEMLRQSRARWLVAPHVAKDPANVRLLHALLCQARWYLQLTETAPEYIRIIAFSLDPRILLDVSQAKDLMGVLAGLFQESAIAFDEAQRAKVLTPGEAMHRTVQYWAALHGMAITSKLRRLNADLFRADALGMNTAETLLLGWGAPPDALATAAQRMLETPP